MTVTDDRPEVETPARRFGWALTSARVLVGLAVSTGFVLAVGALAAAPLPGYAGAALAVDAAPTPSDSIGMCAGPLLAAGRTDSDASALGAAASPQLVAATASGAAPASVVLAGAVPDAGPTAYVAAPEAGEVAELAAAGSATAGSDDLRGLAASACTAPAFDAWLVAGSAATGAADFVVLANPGAVAASATVTVYGTSGPQVAPGGADVVVAAQSQRVIPLAGLALGQSSPVVEVTATGAPVTATLQSSITRTLLPGGVEQTSAGSGPAASVVIPGVVVPDGLAGATQPATTLRVLAPAAGTATVTLEGIGGGTAPAPQQVPLTAGVPVEVDLGSLAAGLWTVSVSADTPVVAAVWQTTGFGEGADFAWFEAAPALAHPTLAAVAAGPSPTLVLTNPSAAPVTVAVTGAGDVTVPPSGSTSVAVRGGSVVTVDPGGGAVHAAIVYSGPGALSGYVVPLGDTAAAAVTVYP